MVQLRHKASLELYSYTKEKMHLMPYNQNYNSLKLNFSIKCWQPRLILKQSSFFQMISQGCINSITIHDTIPQNVSLDSQMATSDIEKANLFNTFFYSVFTQSSFNLPRLPIPPSTICDITISESDV